MMFLRRKEIELAAKIDKLLAGGQIEMPSGLLEDKIWQVLRTLEITEQKSKLERESVLSFMSDISHQLKTPLSSLMLHLELAGDATHTNEERNDFLSECKTQTEKIGWLTDSMLKISRLETGLITVKRIQSDLVKTIHDAVSTVKIRALAKGLALTEHMPDTLELAHDPVWTREALSNILDNAVKYTTVGGISITLEQGAIYTRIDIADTGVGIQTDEYTKIFARFYRVRGHDTQTVDGTGLGLTIAREIIRQQNGNIVVVSKIRRGSTFSVFLQNC